MWPGGEVLQRNILLASSAGCQKMEVVCFFRTETIPDYLVSVWKDTVSVFFGLQMRSWDGARRSRVWYGTVLGVWHHVPHSSEIGFLLVLNATVILYALQFLTTLMAIFISINRVAPCMKFLTLKFEKIEIMLSACWLTKTLLSLCLHSTTQLTVHSKTKVHNKSTCMLLSLTYFILCNICKYFDFWVCNSYFWMNPWRWSQSGLKHQHII
jgi:hypothetical protein